LLIVGASLSDNIDLQTKVILMGIGMLGIQLNQTL